MCDHSFGSLINTSSSPTPPEDQLIFWLMAGYILNGIHNITQENNIQKKTSQKKTLFSYQYLMTRNILLKEKKMSDKLQLTEVMHEILLLEDQTQALQLEEQSKNAENANENNFSTT